MFHQWLELPSSLSQSDVAIAYVVAPTPDTHPSQVPGNVNVELLERFFAKNIHLTETGNTNIRSDWDPRYVSRAELLWYPGENKGYLLRLLYCLVIAHAFLFCSIVICESLNINYWASAYTNRYFIANNELKWIAEFKIRCDADVTNDIIKYHEKCMQNIYIFWLVTPFILPPPYEFGDNTWDL